MSEAKYLSVLSKLYHINRFKASKLSLDNIRKACEVKILSFNHYKEFHKLEGNPQNKSHYIHIAGTNGKGSVALKCAKVLEKFHGSNKSVGLYTSPHIASFRERILVDSEMIDKSFISDYLEHLLQLNEKKDLGLTYFELVTMLAFKYYEQKNVDIVALETGLGGMLDATNIIDPEISVITSIGLDHVDSLGHTVYEIAENKAGIIKPKRPVVVGYNLPYEVFEKKAKELGSPIYQVKETAESVVDFNVENQLIAKLALEKLGLNGFSSENYQNELEMTPRCRLERINIEKSSIAGLKKKPHPVYLDVGHNPPALDRALMALSTRHPDKTIRVVYGASAKKDAYSCLEKMIQYAPHVHLVEAHHNRAMKIHNLIEEKDSLCQALVLDHKRPIFEDVIENGNIAKTLAHAFEKSAESDKDEVLVVCGTFYMMQEVHDYFNIPLEMDPFELNEIQTVHN